MTEMNVRYADIPLRVREVLDEIYNPRDAVAWWTTPNDLMRHYVPLVFRDRPEIRPCEFPEAAYDLANAIADGVFF